jgi:hypothetical protein
LLASISTFPNFFKNGQWYFLTAVYNGTKILLYVNGKIVLSRKVSGHLSNYKTDMYIGKAGNYNGYVKGVIDEVRIYNHALNIEEVNLLFNKD